MTREVVFDTPMVQALKAKRTSKRGYVFRLTDEQVAAVRRARLPDSALLALSAIAGAAFGSRSEDWVTLPPRTMDAFGRGYRWWHTATSKLEVAGLIECRRHVGRAPRYRLVGS